jgi:hypothetical protein
VTLFLLSYVRVDLRRATGRARTGCLRRTGSVLSLMSYGGVCEPSAGVEPAPHLYERCVLTRWTTKACVRSAGFEPAATRLSTWPVYQLQHERVT